MLGRDMTVGTEREGVEGINHMRKIRIKKGLKWKGHIIVFQRPDGRFQVAFDAEEADPAVHDRFIFDRVILTAEQVYRWTGVRLAKEAEDEG